MSRTAGSGLDGLLQFIGEEFLRFVLKMSLLCIVMLSRVYIKCLNSFTYRSEMVAPMLYLS